MKLTEGFVTLQTVTLQDALTSLQRGDYRAARLALHEVANDVESAYQYLWENDPNYVCKEQA